MIKKSSRESFTLLPPGAKEVAAIGLLGNIRGILHFFTEADLVLVDKRLEPKSTDGQDVAKLRADMRKFLRIMMFVRTEISTQCLPVEELEKLQAQISEQLKEKGFPA